jgi:hypothetical protein
MIYDILVNHGLPLNSEGKDDYNLIKNKLKTDEEEPVVEKNEGTIVIETMEGNENAAQVEKNLLANVERFVTRIRMVAQQVIQHRIDNETTDDMKFDPDEDGFDFNHEKALLLHNNMNLLQFIRKNLGIGQKSKQFE